MQTVKALAVRHAEEFANDPAGKVFGAALNLFFFACALTVAIWLTKAAFNMVYTVTVS
jgi:hypothetical protein